MTTFEMTVLFDSESEEAAVEAVDSLGDAFAEYLTGWAASVKSVQTQHDEMPEVQTFKTVSAKIDNKEIPPPTKLIDIPFKHWDEQEETA